MHSCPHCGRSMTWEGDREAFEDLDNNSVCVLQDKKFVRKIINEHDLKNELVFVSNWYANNRDNTKIKQGEMVRYIRLEKANAFYH